MSAGPARAVGATTALAGAGLIAAPTTALRALGAATPVPAPFLFRVVGMFMAVSGSLLVDGAESRLALRWSAAQKVGASGVVTLGVATGVYRPRALLVAGFDGASAVALMRLLRRDRP